MKKTNNNHLPKRIRNFILYNELTTSSLLAEEFKISDTTASIYLRRAVALGIGTKIATKTIVHAPRELPEITPEKRRILNAIREQLPFADVSIWSVQDLNKYAHNIITNPLIVVETGGKSAESVKEALALKEIKAVFYSSKQGSKPSLKMLEKPILLMNRADKTGTIQDPDDPHAHNPTLEKILVDAYFLSTRKKIGPPASEVASALSNVFAFKRALQLSLTLTIAKRRHVESEFNAMLYDIKRTHPDYPIPETYAQITPLTRRQAQFLKEAIGGN